MRLPRSSLGFGAFFEGFAKFHERVETIRVTSDRLIVFSTEEFAHVTPEQVRGNLLVLGEARGAHLQLQTVHLRVWR